MNLQHCSSSSSVFSVWFKIAATGSLVLLQFQAFLTQTWPSKSPTATIGKYIFSLCMWSFNKNSIANNGKRWLTEKQHISNISLHKTIIVYSVCTSTMEKEGILHTAHIIAVFCAVFCQLKLKNINVKMYSFSREVT